MSTNNEPLSPFGQAPPTTVLIVEDDAATADVFALALSQESHDYLPLIASTGSEALTLVKAVKPNLLIIDYHLSDMTGIAFYDTFHALEEFRDVPAVILSASLALHLEEIQARKLHSLEKPFALDAFLLSVKQALAQ